MRKQTLEQNATALKRWRSRLKRAMTAIEKLERQRKRLETAAAQSALSIAKSRRVAPSGDMAPVVAAEPDLAIPSFLDRTKPDPVADQIRAEQADIKKRKARGRIEKMKAKQRGDLKRMPLTGRAALEAIRNA